jgi:hypothetical protein
VNRRALEVHRDPSEEPGARYGFAYRTVTRLRAGDAVGPLGAAQARIAVSDVLPNT